MSEFRSLPYFSRFLILNLMVKVYALFGRLPTFFELLGKKFSGEARQKVYKNYEPTERDVFAAVFSKSGTNWLMQMLQQIICRGEVEFEHIHELVAWPEVPFPSASLRNFESPANAINQMRVIKSSGKAGSIPFNEKAYYVTIIRDPKEACVSGYYFLPAVFGVLDKITVEEWVNLFCGSNYPSGSWAAHTASWWALRDEANVEVLLFEEMKNDPKNCMEKICKMMKIELSDTEMEKVLTKSAFAYMKEKEDLFGAPVFPLMRKKTMPRMVRNGKTKGAGELLTQEQQMRIDTFALRELEELGCDFPYREVFAVVDKVA